MTSETPIDNVTSLAARDRVLVFRYVAGCWYLIETTSPLPTDVPCTPLTT